MTNTAIIIVREHINLRSVKPKAQKKQRQATKHHDKDMGGTEEKNDMIRDAYKPIDPLFIQIRIDNARFF